MGYATPHLTRGVPLNTWMDAFRLQTWPESPWKKVCMFMRAVVCHCRISRICFGRRWRAAASFGPALRTQPRTALPLYMVDYMENMQGSAGSDLLPRSWDAVVLEASSAIVRLSAALRSA